MAMEIERKFLVNGLSWKKGGEGTRYVQGYICSHSRATVRVRIGGDKGYITIKGKSTNISRQEYEYERYFGGVYLL